MRPRLGILLCVAWLLPAVAHAQLAKKGKQTAAEAEAQKAADAHFKKGTAFLESSGFDWAIEEFAAGFELTGEARFLFWVGRSHEDKGEQRKAVEYYRRYLEAEPDGPSSDESGTRVAKLTAEIEHEEEMESARKQREEAEAKKAAAALQAAERRRALLEQALERRRKQMMKEAEEREATAIKRAASRACRNWRLRRAGVITMGAGAVALGLGAWFGLEAKSANDALSDHTTGAWTDDLLDRQEEGESAERNMKVFAGVGAAALLTGGVLYLLGRRGASAERRQGLRVQSSVGAAHATIAVVGRF